MVLVPTALLPVALALIWWLVNAHRDRLGIGRLSWRGTFVTAFLCFEAVVVLITEILSVGSHLTAPVVVVAWLIVIATASVTLAVTGSGGDLHSLMRAVTSWTRRQPVGVAVGCTALAAIFSVLGVVAWIYVPNNGDSLIEHLPRVAHWEQEASVAHFATHELGQIEFAPLHQFNMLHLHLLGGTDRFDGFVQLVAFVVCVLGAGEIARLLGAPGRAQLGAGLLCATIPSAVLQATSTQNIVFTAAIGAAVVTLLLSQARAESVRWRGVPFAIGLGVGVGELVMAKGIAVPMLGPTIVLLAVRAAGARPRSWWSAGRQLVRPALLAGLCLLAVAGPFMKRNHDVFGSIVGPISDHHVSDGISVRFQAANVVRSVALHFRIGDAEDGTLEGFVQRAALGGLEALDGVLGAPDHDPRFVLGGPYDPFARGDFRVSQRAEEASSDPWHAILVVASGTFVVVCALRRPRRDELAAVLAVGLSLGFVLFSATASWFPFMARYHIVLLVLWCPIIAIVLARRKLLAAAIVALAIAVLPQLTDNGARSLVDLNRETGLAAYIPFADDQSIFVGPSDYEAVRIAIVESACTRVGIANWVILEYPIWVGLEQSGWDGEIQHVFVLNESASLGPHDFSPCALVWQTLDRPPHQPLPGWIDEDHGGLTVSFRETGDGR